MKTTKAQFKTFVKWCEHYRQKFGLINWRVEYSHMGEDGLHAHFSYNLTAMSVTIFFAENWTDEVVVTTENVLRHAAKHEMLELLLTRLVGNATARFIMEAEIREATHEVVQVLCNVIK
ncbi:MAG: hypothetical protein ACYTEO_19835 [Planctomycetota bacterium]